MSLPFRRSRITAALTAGCTGFLLCGTAAAAAHPAGNAVSEAAPVLATEAATVPRGWVPNGYNATPAQHYELRARWLGETGRSFFAPLSDPLQDANTGLVLGAGLGYHGYHESMTSRVVDKERGWLPRLHLGAEKQWGHLGAGFDVALAKGSTDYTGALQTTEPDGSVVYTPNSTSTDNTVLDFTAHLDAAFSPVPRMAVLPGVYAGYHAWLRDIQGTGGYSEHYRNKVAGFQTRVQYRYDAVLVGFGAHAGETFGAKMTAPFGTFGLGGKLTYGLSAMAQWTLTPSLALSVSDHWDVMSYGASAAHAIDATHAVSEPASRTWVNTLEIAVKWM